MKIWWPLPCRPSFSPRDTQGRNRGLKTYKYALTVVDVASHWKEAEPLTSKDSDEVASALHKIYKWPLKWPCHERNGKTQKKKKTFAVDARRFTGTRQSWKDIIAPLLCPSGTSMLLKCYFLKAKDIPNGSLGFLLWSLLWGTQAKNPSRPSK